MDDRVHLTISLEKGFIANTSAAYDIHAPTIIPPCGHAQKLLFGSGFAGLGVTLGTNRNE